MSKIRVWQKLVLAGLIVLAILASTALLTRNIASQSVVRNDPRVYPSMASNVIALSGFELLIIRIPDADGSAKARHALLLPEDPHLSIVEQEI